MKRILLLSLVLIIGLTGFSQNIPTVSKSLRDVAIKTEKQDPVDNPTNFTLPVNHANSSKALAPNEVQIGLSYYDLWSNTIIGNRLYRWDDGTMAAVWIYGEEATSFPDRGTGYNFYDGTEWGPIPTERLENRHCGWPNISAWGADGEVNLAHNGVEGLTFMWRDTKGTGDWTQMNYLGPSGIENDPTWPRVITTGADNEYVHMIYNSYVEYAGQPQAMLYSRSDDGGATWDPRDEILEGTGDDYYFEIGADQYMMAAQGNTVGILVGGAWIDMFYMRSDDNGETWDKIMINEHPYPFFDWNTTIADTFYCTDNSGFMTFDNQGKAHVVFGISRVAHEEVGTTYQFYPFIDGVGYWNDDMDPFSDDLNALAPPQYGYANSEMIEDENYIGYMQDVDGDGEIHLAGWPNTTIDNIMSYRELGPSTMPTITVDDQGRRFVLFASTTETYVNDQVNYKHVWARAYDNGMWGPFVDLSSDIVHIFDECIYPILASTSDDNIHYMYMADVTPGLALDEDHGYQENRFIYASLPKTDLLTGVEEPELVSESNVTQNRPNPFTGTSVVEVTLEQSADLSLEVTNLMGQKVYEVDLGNVPAGTHPVTIDGTGLDSGVYFYTVSAGNSRVTRKMIIE
ncbi:MAG: T9SS type A sorting domain-containing protein [Bacteroidales bacterium]